MADMRCAVILAGGAGRRMGTDKSILQFEGRPLIERSAERLLEVVDQVVVVARDRDQADLLQELVPGAVMAVDPVRGYGPLAGLLAGMARASGEYAFATGCDLPFLNPRVIEALFERAMGYDGAVPEGRGLPEPLHAVYRRARMEEACREAMERGSRRISSTFGDLRIRFVDLEELREMDPELLTFFNVNTLEDLKRAEMARSDSQTMPPRTSGRRSGSCSGGTKSS
ncbi:MAG: molybdenum cofactor guanylyltransferase [Methanosarcinales archaeon]|nr:molybdenum cofactor guanylyltransferase [Methanosarcinales archaeon]